MFQMMPCIRLVKSCDASVYLQNSMVSLSFYRIKPSAGADRRSSSAVSLLVMCPAAATLVKQAVASGLTQPLLS